jgi:hypothetical protein
MTDEEKDEKKLTRRTFANFGSALHGTIEQLLIDTRVVHQGRQSAREKRVNALKPSEWFMHPDEVVNGYRLHPYPFMRDFLGPNWHDTDEEWQALYKLTRLLADRTKPATVERWSEWFDRVCRTSYYHTTDRQGRLYPLVFRDDSVSNPRDVTFDDNIQALYELPFSSKLVLELSVRGGTIPFTYGPVEDGFGIAGHMLIGDSVSGINSACVGLQRLWKIFWPDVPVPPPVQPPQAEQPRDEQDEWTAADLFGRVEV